MPELTGLRGLSAFAVVAFHAVLLFDLLVPSWQHPLARAGAAYGWVGVDVFFVLSGFLLALPLMARPAHVQTSGFWRTYLVKRFARIAPPYYVSILAIALLLGTHPMFRIETVDLLRHLLYVHTFWADTTLSINPVAWTLAIEVQFYLLLPFLVPLFAGRRPGLALAVAAVLTLLYRWWAFVPGEPWATTWRGLQLPAFALHFALGIWAARAYVDGRVLPWRARLVLPVAAGLLVVAPIAWMVPAAALPAADTFVAHLTVRPMIAVAAALVIFSVVTRRGRCARLLSSRMLQQGGEISYSVYLVHFPAVAWLMVRAPAVTEQGLALFIGASLLFSWLVGTAFYHLVERPSLTAKALWVRALRRAPVPVPAQTPDPAAEREEPTVEGPATVDRSSGTQ